jgi:hypothetical protein
LMKMILGTNPSDDTVAVTEASPSIDPVSENKQSLGILLLIDYYALMAKQYDFLLSMTGITASKPSYLKKLRKERQSRLSGKASDDSSSTKTESPYNHWEYAYIVDVPEAVANSDMSSNSSPSENTTGVYSIASLPNWWYSLALAAFLGIEEEERRRKYNELEKYVTPEQQKENEFRSLFFTKTHATVLLQEAVMMYPYLIVMILEDIHAASYSSYARVMKHPYFKTALTRLVF